MVIDADHIQNFLEMSQYIDQERKKLSTASSNQIAKDDLKTFFGPMRIEQLERTIPGFVRVEVLQAGSSAQEKLDKVPVASSIETIDTGICCGQYDADPSTYPSSDKIVLWETAIRAMAVREYPGTKLGWMALLPGNNPPRGNLGDNATIGSYWSGEDGAFGNDAQRPGLEGSLFAQQGGFMATREQILFFQFKACAPGGFLPPFEHKMWGGVSGLKAQNVEFWSGGYHLFNKCNMQRILSIDPAVFSRQLLFHSANNKQRTLPRNRMVKAKDFLGQMHTVKEAAIREKARQITV